MDDLTKHQASVLRFCGEFFAANDQIPPRHIICNHFGWSSTNAADTTLKILLRKGYIAVNQIGKLRFTAKGRAYIAQALTTARWFPTSGSLEPTNGSVCATSTV